MRLGHVFTGAERRPDRPFFGPAMLKNFELHPVFLRFFALQGGKIPRPSGIHRQ
jgi:hypothetical protein